MACDTELKKLEFAHDLENDIASLARLLSQGNAGRLIHCIQYNLFDTIKDCIK